jgi:hypothetical protein
MLYFRATESQRGEQLNMASCQLVVPHRATRAGAAGDKDLMNFGEFSFFSHHFEIRVLDVFINTIRRPRCQPGIMTNRHREDRLF